MPMPRRSPFLDMTNLYNKAGGADECAEMLINNPEAHKLFEANIAYRRGEIARVYKHARYFLNAHSGLYAILGAGMLLSNCAIWSGDEDIWYTRAKLDEQLLAIVGKENFQPFEVRYQHEKNP